MWHDRVAPNTIAFSAAISAFEKGMQWIQAFKLLCETRHDRVAQNTITC